jgi:membrane protein YqaA with SNARE-associated domain
MTKRRFGGAEIFLVIAAVALLVFAGLYFWWPGFADWLGQTSWHVQQFALREGYWGGFVITAVSNAALVIPIPYGTVLFVLGSIGLNPWLLGLITGFAAGLGEVVGYSVGRGTGALVSAEQKERFRRINELVSRHPRLTPLIIFMLGVLPIPDDILLIPLGMIKYPFWKTIVPCLLGKFIMTTTFSVAGKYSLPALRNLLGSESGFWSGIIIVALTVLMIYLTIKIKWEKLIK